MIGVTLSEYHRQWDRIMQLFHEQKISAEEAIQAIRKLTSQPIWR